MSAVTLHRGRSWFLEIGLAFVVACGGKESSVGAGETADQAPADPVRPPTGALPPPQPANEAGPAVTPNDGGGASDATAEGGVIAAAGVACGATSCTVPAFCQVCDPINPASTRSCETDPAKSCLGWGQRPPLRISCDGAEDCMGNERCTLYEGSVGTYARCMPRGDFGNIVCRSPADCPTQGEACEPYAAPDYPIRVCK